MRRIAKSAVLAGFLVILLTLATGPAFAEMMSGPGKTPSGIHVDDRAKQTIQSEKDFSGAAKAGATEQEKARQERELKARIKAESETEALQRSKTDKSGEAKAGGEVKSLLKGKDESGVSRDPKAGMSPQMRRDMKVEGPVKFETRASDAREPMGTVKRGEAIVARVDQPGSCLKIRRGPGISYDIAECAVEGKRLSLTGVFSQDGRWAQLDNQGWVFFAQVRSDVRPTQGFASEGSFDRPAAAGGKETRRGYGGYHHYGGPYSYYYAPGSCGWHPGSGYGYGYGYQGSMYWNPWFRGTVSRADLVHTSTTKNALVGMRLPVRDEE